jgi:hypothetical protein
MHDQLFIDTTEWTTIEEYAKTKIDFLKTFLKLPNGIPSHDTFGDIFAKIDPLQFEECFLAWTLGVCQLSPGEVVSIEASNCGGLTTSTTKKRPFIWSVPGPIRIDWF